MVAAFEEVDKGANGRLHHGWIRIANRVVFLVIAQLRLVAGTPYRILGVVWQ